MRLGAELPNVIDNLTRFRKLRATSPWKLVPKTELGIAFVAMKRNIDDLPEVLKLARRLGANHFSVSNVLPVTEEMQAETLYNKTLKSLAYIPSSFVPDLTLPKMDFNESTRDAFSRRSTAATTSATPAPTGAGPTTCATSSRAAR